MQSGGREGPLLPVGAGVLSLGSPQLDWQPGSLYSSVSLASEQPGSAISILPSPSLSLASRQAGMFSLPRLRPQLAKLPDSIVTGLPLPAGTSRRLQSVSLVWMANSGARLLVGSMFKSGPPVVALESILACRRLVALPDLAVTSITDCTLTNLIG